MTAAKLDCTQDTGRSRAKRSQTLLSTNSKLTEASSRACLCCAPFNAHGYVQSPVLEDGAVAIKQYLAHRQSRVDEVLSALRDVGKVPGGATARELTISIYQNLPSSLMLAAERSLTLALLKLESDGLAQRRNIERDGDEVELWQARH